MTERAQRMTSMGSDALAKIREALLEGTLAPGQRILEADLAERFEMSRTPVREAIHVLRSKGLVTHMDGFLVVTRLDRRLLDEIYAMRETLEGMSARLAATNAKPQDVEDLQILISGEGKAASPRQRTQINIKFHGLLAALADNRYLTRALEDLSETLTLLGPTTLADNERFAEARNEHAAVVASIAAGDAEKAESGMRTHVRAAWKARRNMLLADSEKEAVVASAARGRRR
jgi:DNA-binding GntR family transcriptional regulator